MDFDDTRNVINNRSVGATTSPTTTLDFLAEARRPMTRIHLDRGVIAAVLVALAVCAAGAQSGTTECDIAAAAVGSGRANAEYVREITRCPFTAPTAISALMTRSGLTDEVREAVVDAGGTVRDARLYRAAFSVASGRGTAADRLAALRMLMRHYDLAYQPSLEYLTSGARGAPIPRGFDVLAVQGATDSERRDSSQTDPLE
jgi:hypothetical protein